jgi:ADP-ribose pyrophosphatase YjhB (NUDIX family)
MRFCSACAAPVEMRVPEGDNRARHVCTACGTIHYTNPRIVAGCLVVHDDRILLCRRDIEPRRGYWTFPAGYLESGETIAQGAVRETWEEATARVELDELYTMFNLPYISQVYVFYRARLVDGAFAPGIESQDVQLFSREEIPWNELAFPVVRSTLEHYFVDRETGHYPVRVEDLLFSTLRPPGAP